MSVAPSRNPLPKATWRLIKRELEAKGIAVEEREVVFIDKVGDEYCAFAVLYVRER